MRRRGDADAPRPVKVKCPSDGAEGEAAPPATGNHAVSHVTQTTIQRRQEGREAREAALEFSLRLSLPFPFMQRLN